MRSPSATAVSRIPQLAVDENVDVAPHPPALVEDPPRERGLGALQLGQRRADGRPRDLVLVLFAGPLLEGAAQLHHRHQRISFLSMNLIARRHEMRANPTRNPTCQTSIQPSNPNTAWRTSSTQW